MRDIIGWTAGTVFDPFMGSGVACLEFGRPFIGIEIKPTHFDTAYWRMAGAAARLDQADA